MTAPVIVGLDDLRQSARAMASAAREAEVRGAPLWLGHTYQWLPPLASCVMPGDVSPEGAVSDAATGLLVAAVKQVHRDHPGLDVHSCAMSGPAATCLADLAREASLLVVGGRDGFTGPLLGSALLRTVAHAACPVMVVRGAEREPSDTVIAAIDIVDPAEELLAFAFAEAAVRSARLKALSVWDSSWAVYVCDDDQVRRASRQAMAAVETALERLVAPWRAKYPDVAVDTEAADGAPAAILTRATTSADLIVAGAHRHGRGRGGMRLGPIARTLLQHASCSVVIVPRG